MPPSAAFVGNDVGAVGAFSIIFYSRRGANLSGKFGAFALR